MYRFSWDALVTEQLLEQLHYLCPDGVTSANADSLRSLLARLFESVGGLPIETEIPNDATRTAMGRRLLLEAAQRFLTRGAAQKANGFVLQGSPTDALSRLIVALPLTEVNWATAEELTSLPGIGQSLAGRIIEERTNAGYFSDLADLVRRVGGLGPSRADAIANTTAFTVPSPPGLVPQVPADLDDCIRQILQACWRLPVERRLVAAIDLLATTCARDPHPATEQLLVRNLREAPPLSATLAAEWASLLDGTEYYELLPAIIGEAAASIALCMFHVALGGTEHSTRTLVNALVAARQRGLDVRVLLDQDRSSDPYKSRIINTPAKEYLQANGVQCRFDRRDRLLHSKYLVIDSELVVLGSHNWSANSYFDYDDLSVVVKSPALGHELIQRFESLWQTSEA